MFKSLKNSLALVLGSLAVWAALSIPLRAQAQSYPIYSGQSLGSFTCTTNAGTNVAAVIPCGKMQNVGIQATYICDKASTNILTAYITRSMDGSTYESPGTNVAFNVTATTPGSTASVICYLNTLGAGFMKINYWTNTGGAGAIITNGAASYGIRIGAP
jgi:hypothetical protein